MSQLARSRARMCTCAATCTAARGEVTTPHSSSGRRRWAAVESALCLSQRGDREPERALIVRQIVYPIIPRRSGTAAFRHFALRTRKHESIRRLKSESHTSAIGTRGGGIIAFSPRVTTRYLAKSKIKGRYNYRSVFA